MSRQLSIEGFLARDKDGSLWFYTIRPNRFVKVWLPKLNNGVCFRIEWDSFPQINWEDDPVPTLVTLKIEK